MARRIARVIVKGVMAALLALLARAANTGKVPAVWIAVDIPKP